MIVNLFHQAHSLLSSFSWIWSVLGDFKGQNIRFQYVFVILERKTMQKSKDPRLIFYDFFSFGKILLLRLF